MSTGLECAFVEVTDRDEWFYVLQDGDCPVMHDDWMDYATAYGPFSTRLVAEKHLNDNHANPGGWYTMRATSDTLPDPIVRLVAGRGGAR